MKKERRMLSRVAVTFCATVIILYGIRKMERWREEDAGVPDVISSISANNYQYLTVVANSRKIDDKEAFARGVVHMCQENAFRSMKFAAGVNGYPSGLDIKVYLQRGDIEKKGPVCNIKFVTDEYDEDPDIRNDSDKFHLYLDGNEIEFY